MTNKRLDLLEFGAFLLLIGFTFVMFAAGLVAMSDDVNCEIRADIDDGEAENVQLNCTYSGTSTQFKNLMEDSYGRLGRTTIQPN